MEGITNVENYGEVVKKLQKYISEGFILHGSKKLVPILEPRQATDDNINRTIGKSFAIYGEAHDIRIPILMALFTQADESLHSWKSGYSGHGPGTPLEVTGENFTFSPGYVYVLSPDHFTTEEDENEREYISHEAITPIDILKIDPTILKEFSDIVLVDRPATLS
jgi:hypothetical protein